MTESQINEKPTRVFISLPMNGKTDQEVKEERDKAIVEIKKLCGENIEILDTYISETYPEGTKAAVWYLGRSIQILSKADVAYFAENWSKYRGCIIEHQICLKYDIEIIKS